MRWVRAEECLLIALLENGQLGQRTQARSSESPPDKLFVSCPFPSRDVSHRFLFALGRLSRSDGGGDEET